MVHSSNSQVHKLTALVVCGALALLAFLALAGLAQPAFAACENRGANPGAITTGQAQKSVVCLINAQREAHGLDRLRANRDLRAAARRHSAYMRDNRCFDHVCPGEPDVAERLDDYLSGAGTWGYGENIAWGESGYGTPKRIVQSWMRSQGHRDIILTAAFEHIGVGAVWGSPYSSSTNAGIYTADFGYGGG